MLKLQAKINYKFCVDGDIRYFFSNTLSESKDTNYVRIYLKNKPTYLIKYAKQEMKNSGDNLFKNGTFKKNNMKKIQIIPNISKEKAYLLSHEPSWSSFKNHKWGSLYFSDNKIYSEGTSHIANYLLIDSINEGTLSHKNLDTKLIFKKGKKTNLFNEIHSNYKDWITESVDENSIKEINNILELFFKFNQDLISSNSWHKLFRIYEIDDPSLISDFNDEHGDDLRHFLMEKHLGFWDVILSSGLMIEINNLNCFEKKYDDFFEQVKPKNFYVYLNLKILRWLFINQEFLLAPVDELFNITLGTSNDKLGVEITIYPRLIYSHVQAYFIINDFKLTKTDWAMYIEILKLILDHFLGLLNAFFQIKFGFTIKIASNLVMIISYNVAYGCIAISFRFTPFEVMDSLNENHVADQMFYDNDDLFAR